MLVSEFIHVESSGNDLHGTSYVMMSNVSDMEHKMRPDCIPPKHEIQATIKKD